MSTARKTLDLHGQDPRELASEIALLPHGRYVLVPEHELMTDDDLSDPSSEQAGELKAALAAVAEGRTIPLEDFARQLEQRVRSAAERS